MSADLKELVYRRLSAAQYAFFVLFQQPPKTARRGPNPPGMR
jgi:hypothetical protein